MSIHLIKLAVGCQDLESLAAAQARYICEYEGAVAVPVHTRNMPRRAVELLRDGGSMYRVMKSRVWCRQEILGIETAENEARGKHCVIMLSPILMKTVLQPHRPFQGWRYFESAKAPLDIGVYVEGEEQPPEDMAEELADMGLL